jgi:hypothetical protein
MCCQDGLFVFFSLKLANVDSAGHRKLFHGNGNPVAVTPFSTALRKQQVGPVDLTGFLREFSFMFEPLWLSQNVDPQDFFINSARQTNLKGCL